MKLCLCLLFVAAVSGANLRAKRTDLDLFKSEVQDLLSGESAHHFASDDNQRNSWRRA